MMASVQQMLEADCSVLLLRALLGKKVAAFGDDGLGKFGRSPYPKYFEIKDIEIDVIADDDGDDPVGFAVLRLDGYDANGCGHIFTDQNFLISVRNLLIAEHIDPKSIDYDILETQLDFAVTMRIDLPLLLDWA